MHFGSGFLQQWVLKAKCLAKNLHIQRKSLFFENAIKDSLSKIEVTPKNYFNKNCAHIPLFWFEKKNQKDSEESRYWKLILKVRL